VAKFERYIEQKYGKKVQLSIIDVSEPQEFFDHIRAKNVDIISPAHNIPKSPRWPFLQSGLILPLDLTNIPNYKNIIPSLRFSHYVSKQRVVYGVPIVYGYYGLAYNHDLIQTAPTSWNVLWQPEYHNKFSISADYYEANIYITALSLGYRGNEIYDYQLLSSDPKFLKRLQILANSPARFWYGVDKADDLFGLSFATAWGVSFQELKAKGENFQFSSPKEGTTGWVDHWLVGYSLKNSPFKKKMAEEWINFTLSNEMQVYYLRELGQHPVSRTINQFLTKQEINHFHLDENDYFKNNVNLWQVLMRRQHNGFKFLWDKAKALK
jgi:spermidine/putrescine transport system substrate-binding protein